MNSSLEQKIVSDLLTFTKEKVTAFLTEHPNETFYAFAYDCNAQYAEVNLCFNTATAFDQTLKYYQQKYPQHYSTQEDIINLKYNTGDWEYQCFDTLYVLTEEQQEEIYTEDVYTQLDELMTIFIETLKLFRETEEYKKIPKTDDFKLICIDHDEEPIDVLDRIN